MSKLVNFKARFYRNYLNWRAKHPEADEDKAEVQYEAAYKAWCERPKKWLDGKSPNEYFMQSTPEMLMTMLKNYVCAGYELPEPMQDSIIEKAEETYPTLISFIESERMERMDADEVRDLQNESIKLIVQMDKEHPYKRYISLLLDTASEDALADELCTRLMHYENKREILDAYEYSSGYSRRCMLEIISMFEDSEEAVELTLAELRYAQRDFEFYAQCLARLGDARAIEHLKIVLDEPDIDYYTYIEIKNAIEVLGGETVHERQFDVYMDEAGEE